MATLSPKQEKALIALLTEPTISAAAKTAGIGERTLHTWLGEDAFAKAYRDARRAAVQQTIARLQQASSMAVTTLMEVMDGMGNSPAARVSAAKAVIEQTLKSTEIEDLAARIEALEQAQGDRTP